MSEEKYCISCGEEISPDAELCPECGVRQEVRSLSSDQKHCTQCGEKIDIKAEICPECGVENPDPGVSAAMSAGSDLEENVAGALAYILGVLSGLYFYVTEEENDFVRFHAMQSIIFSLAAFVGSWVINTVLFSLLFSPTAFGSGGFGVFRILSLLTTLLWVAVVGVWVLLMFKAYNGERYKLPVLGDFAEQNA